MFGCRCSAVPAQSALPAGLLQTARAVRIVHPFPTLMNAAATGALAELATRGSASPWVVLRLVLAMFAIQSTIGVVNDLRDRGLDARSKPSKPLVSGAVTPGAALLIALVSLLAALALAAGFGIAAWLLALAGLACGLLYDLWLKRTPFSGLPYAVGLPLLPLWVWVATGRFRELLLAVIPLGLLLGLALHLANCLPDFEGDAGAGVDGLAQRLGRRSALLLCWVAYALALLLVVLSALRFSYSLAVLLPGLAAGALALATAIVLALRRPGRSSLQAGWTLLVLGTAALALGWLGAIP
jgi:4-hydroxybenzoate polyprenyltransferase